MAKRTGSPGGSGARGAGAGGLGTWTGRREDTVGEATVTETGTEIRLEYVADVRSRGQVTRLGFADVIYRRAEGVVVNNEPS